MNSCGNSWFGSLRTCSTNVGHKVVNFYFHSICSETKCSLTETEVSEERYRLKKLLQKTLKEVLKSFHLNILSGICLFNSKRIFTKSTVENTGSDQNQQKILKKSRQECILVERWFYFHFPSVDALGFHLSTIRNKTSFKISKCLLEKENHCLPGLLMTLYIIP